LIENLLEELSEIDAGHGCYYQQHESRHHQREFCSQP
jgi:hypothetical protein